MQLLTIMLALMSVLITPSVGHLVDVTPSAVDAYKHHCQSLLSAARVSGVDISAVPGLQSAIANCSTLVTHLKDKRESNGAGAIHLGPYPLCGSGWGPRCYGAPFKPSPAKNSTSSSNVLVRKETEVDIPTKSARPSGSGSSVHDTTPQCGSGWGPQCFSIGPERSIETGGPSTVEPTLRKRDVRVALVGGNTTTLATVTASTTASTTAGTTANPTTTASITTMVATQTPSPASNTAPHHGRPVPNCGIGMRGTRCYLAKVKRALPTVARVPACGIGMRGARCYLASLFKRETTDRESKEKKLPAVNKRSRLPECGVGMRGARCYKKRDMEETCGNGPVSVLCRMLHN